MLEAEKQKLEQQSMQSQPPPLLQDFPQSAPQMMNMYTNQSFPAQSQNFTHQQDIVNQFPTYNLPPPIFSIPDLSRPPPGFNNSSAENSPPPAEVIEEIEPDPQPFFTLPAGLMVPLIGLEDCSYRGLNTALIKLPPPTAPSEKLLAAVEAFYSAPSHERPRDTEGWEKLGLYEYFKIKNAVRKQKEEAIAKGERQKSKSPSPIPDSFTKPVKKQKKRAYHSKSPEPRISPSKSRSATPEIRPTITSTANRSRSRKRSRSPSPSPTPYRNFNRDSRVDRRKRSVTPPSFMGATPKAATEFIDEGNKGHQMLKRLGWTSGGLGAGKKQGISEPISGGELRDRNDLYKVSNQLTFRWQSNLNFLSFQGVGMNTNDPYENFRKNRSNNFIVRMKSRGEDKN